MPNNLKPKPLVPWILLACWLGAAVSPAQQAGKQPNKGRAEPLAKGKAELAQGRHDAARETFQGAYDETEDAKYLFYQAVALQKSAADRDEEQQDGPLKKAAKLYRQYLERKPNSASVLNNLAQVYAELGQIQDAEKSFRQAIALDDPRQDFYRQNYAKFLDAQGNWKKATEAWNRLIDGAPEADSAHTAMMERYLAQAPVDRPWETLVGRDRQLRQTRGEEMAGYLWGRLEAGQPARAMSGALEALKIPGAWPTELRRELMTLVAAGLAERIYDPATFIDSQTGREMAELTDAPQLAQGAKELLQLHLPEDPKLEPNDYRWWKTGDPQNDPHRGVWPVDGFLNLIRSLGRGYQRSGDSDRAARYFRLAADFRNDDVDPEAVSDLVSLYAGENRLDQVSRVAEDYEHRLFGGKTDAYRGSKTEKIFNYHRTLGGIYSLTGQWGDENTVTSAIFQLDRALRTFELLESQAPEVAQKKATYTPELTTLLAQGYESTGRVEKSYDVRLAAAERYQRVGNEEAAQEVLQPIRNEPPPPTADPRLKSRYAELVPMSPQHYVPNGRIQLDPQLLMPVDRSPASELFNEGIRVADSDYEEAANQFRGAIELDPKLTEAYLALAQLHLSRQEFKEALMVAEQLLEIDPANVEGHLHRHLAAASSGDLQTAETALKSLSEYQPSAAAMIYCRQAEDEIEGGDPEAAKERLARCKRLAGKDREVRSTVKDIEKKIRKPGIFF